MCSLRARALQQAVVDRLAHQVVVEAVNRSLSGAPAGSMNCLRVSVAKCTADVAHAVHRAPALRPRAAETPGRSPTPGSTAARSARRSWSSRASSSAWMVGGTLDVAARPAAHPAAASSRRSAPLSISIDSICSTYSGLPSAAVNDARDHVGAATRWRRASWPPPEPTRRRSAGCSTRRVRRRLRSPQSGWLLDQLVARCGEQQDRRVLWTRRARARAAPETPVSAQWMSSTSATTGVVGRRGARGTCAPPS